MSPPEVLTVEEQLAAYGNIVGRAVDQTLDRIRSNRWIDDLVADYPNRGGKYLRPALLLATCQAFGGSIEEALPTAVGIEILHNAFLIHDDIEDGSELRRGRPTLHRLHGVPLALNAGDALAVLALDQLRTDDRLGSRVSQALAAEFSRMTRHTIEGQATELGWRRERILEVTPDDYLHLIGRKTCWYTTIYPLRAGALIGSGGMATLADLNRFGFYLGAAFQIRDDVLNLVGSEHVVGKEQLGDLREGKRTLMLVHLLANASQEERAFVSRFLELDEQERTAASIATIYDLMAQHGSIDFALEYGAGIAVAARQAFDIAFRHIGKSPYRAFIQQLISYMLDRAV